MGIKHKDLVKGQYYKGYNAPAPAGKKCFFYVEDTKFSSQGVHVVDLWYILRKTGHPQLWHTVQFVGNQDDETLAKQDVTITEVLGEGHPACNPAAKPGTVPLGTTPPHYIKPPSYTLPQPTEPDSKEQSKAERNKGKAVVPGNGRSPVCLKCGKPNRQIPMMMMWWCTECEPE